MSQHINEGLWRYRNAPDVREHTCLIKTPSRTVTHIAISVKVIFAYCLELLPAAVDLYLFISWALFECHLPTHCQLPSDPFTCWYNTDIMLSSSLSSSVCYFEMVAWHQSPEDISPTRFDSRSSRRYISVYLSCLYWFLS